MNVILKLYVALSLGLSLVIGFRCDRRPYGTTVPASGADGRYSLTLVGADAFYVPDQLYKVKLSSTDEQSTFTAYMISAEGELQPDSKNPRRMITKPSGLLRPQDYLARFSDRCHNSLEQTNAAHKTAVEVYWQAPSSSNGCVTLRAMVAESEEVWFEDGSPLTQKLCEDNRQPDDVASRINYNCQICDEAKYELTYTGTWSRNTHPQQYPDNDWVPKFSDLIGVSHKDDFLMWAPGTLATDGLRELAEHTNTTQFEAELKQKVGDGVRTIIKGKGHGYPKMGIPTYAFFRADKENHLISTAIALHPSPDWFLGVTRFELCRDDNTWLPEREVNLYPWDAGTDNGVSYESSNDVTTPQDAINRVHLSSYDRNSPFFEIDMKNLRPFATLKVKLIRTYQRACMEDTGTSDIKENGASNMNKEETDNTSNPDEPSRYHSSDDDFGGQEILERDTDSTDECPLTEWEDWLPCSGRCVEGRVNGYQSRVRYHLVNGIPVEKYDVRIPSHTKKEVPIECKENYSDYEHRECSDVCSETDNGPITPSRRFGAITPGQPWKSQKRHSP